jgi:hypothetical protein
MSRLAVALLVLALALGGCRRDAAVTDLEGRAVDPLAHAGAPTVLFFLATHCPISNRYAPEIAALEARFAPRGVDVWLVYPSAGESAASIGAHVREHRLPARALRDPKHVLVARAGATVTPEAVVFVDGRVVYRGRIDDRQVDFGVARPEPTTRDLAAVLDAVASGGAPPIAETTPIGCSIPSP